MAVFSEILISQAIEKLRQLTQINVQTSWRYYSQDLPNYCQTHKSCPQGELINWQIAQPNEKGYITWSAGHKVQWFAQRLVVPHDLHGYPLKGLNLRIRLTWWAENAQIFVHGKLVQEGDLFDSSARVLLSKSVHPGEEITIALRLISPGHDIGALMHSSCLYEFEGQTEEIKNTQLTLEPGFVADELTVLHKYLATFEPEKLELLTTEITQINWDFVENQSEFNQILSTLRQNLQPLTLKLKQRCLHLLGHAHLDMAWLWTTKETWEVAERTFSSVLNLQQKFPELTFCHTTPALYAWIEQHHPDLFAAIQKAVAQKGWEVLGGMWVEPEVNLVAGESLVRQLLYGQRYIEKKFGAITTIAWLPDSFGFCWQLPQIFQQSGIEYFVTGKLHWNDTTKFPYGLFWWQAPDGTRLLTLMSPPNITGVMDTNPITMANYALDWEIQTGQKDAFWLPGVGDHGGGPSQDMLEVQQRWQTSPFFPRLEFTTALDYLQTVSAGREEEKSSSLAEIPVWNDELYLEFHRGCYTTHSEQKRHNRYCEVLLYQAELFASLATIISEQNNSQHTLSSKKNNTDILVCQDWQANIESAWRKVLFNQFHDILPGTSIPEVFVEANQAWQEVKEIGEKILKDSLEAIASFITLPSKPHPNAQPLIIFNSLNWQRSEVVSIPVSQGNWVIYDYQGKNIQSQLTQDNQLLFLAQNIPSIGYCLFWLVPDNSEQKDNETLNQPESNSEFILENKYLKVVIDPETGNLSSIFDKINQREVLSGAGNQLQAFRDNGQYWDAWNIDPQYHQHPLPPTQLKSIQWLDVGPLQWRVRAVRKLNKSEFCQDYILSVNCAIIKIATIADWQENHILVKAAFPLNLNSDHTTYEIPCGAIQRPNKPKTAKEQAKWEVPALRWADLTDIDNDYGVSLLNDCKYGYDSKPNQLRLTLLRSSKWPDSQADRGKHQFTYALYSHKGNWKSGRTVHRGYELNLPLQVFLSQSDGSRISTELLSPVGKLLDLQAPNLILMALKPAEISSLGWILRCYECHGELAKLSLNSDLELAIADQVNLLERKKHSSENITLEESIFIKPWKISTVTLKG